MLSQQVVSVTDLRKKTKECFENLEQTPKFIFINNKIVAVLLAVNEYESLIRPDLMELPIAQVTPAMKKRAQKAKKLSRNDLIDL
ncbi:MAG: hypothetical protein WCW30_00510 [Candidatus Gracilibacteria bacterium]